MGLGGLGFLAGGVASGARAGAQIGMQYKNMKNQHDFNQQLLKIIQGNHDTMSKYGYQAPGGEGTNPQSDIEAANAASPPPSMSPVASNSGDSGAMGLDSLMPPDNAGM